MLTSCLTKERFEMRPSCFFALFLIITVVSGCKQDFKADDSDMDYVLLAREVPIGQLKKYIEASEIGEYTRAMIKGDYIYFERIFTSGVYIETGVETSTPVKGPIKIKLDTPDLKLLIDIDKLNDTWQPISKLE